MILSRKKIRHGNSPGAGGRHVVELASPENVVVQERMVRVRADIERFPNAPPEPGSDSKIA
ncbi:MAG: hypothetical protein JWM58_4586 [Rhizobium sp.]|nr:hypothetical protein [Rhizobium sp.]